MPSIPPAVSARRPSDVQRPSGRAFCGDQIFRHELGDGGEIEKCGTGGISGGGVNGCADSESESLAELDGTRERWVLPMAELKMILKEQRHELG